MGHEFYWSHLGKERQERLQPLEVVANQTLYVFNDNTGDPEIIQETLEELQFYKEYLAKNGYVCFCFLCLCKLMCVYVCFVSFKKSMYVLFLFVCLIN